jgi:hypothetical protein
MSRFAAADKLQAAAQATGRAVPAGLVLRVEEVVA